MNLRISHLIPPALILACGLAAAEATLKVGSTIDLRALTAAEWIKGEAPKACEPGKLYVFECWATWCGGCVANIPHLNELHHKFRDKGLLVHGIDVWEKDKELGVKFVQAKGDAMAYPVAYVAKDSLFEKDWLKAAGVKSIPHAFVVKDGKLILSCHPGYLTDETVTAMLLSPGSCGKTIESITRKLEAADRFVAAQRAFNDAEKKADFAGMETAIADFERENARHPVAGKLKERLRLAREKQVKQAPGK